MILIIRIRLPDAPANEPEGIRTLEGILLFAVVEVKREVATVAL